MRTERLNVMNNLNNTLNVGKVLLLAFLVSTCTYNAADTETIGEELMEISREWSEVAATGNIDSLLTYWHQDAVMMPPGQPPLRGKEAIRKYVEAGFQAPGFEISWEPVSAHVSGHGDMAYLIERNRVAYEDSLGNLVNEHNKVVTVWRKQDDGSWKNVVDMWNAVPSPSEE